MHKTNSVKQKGMKKASSTLKPSQLADLQSKLFQNLHTLDTVSHAITSSNNSGNHYRNNNITGISGVNSNIGFRSLGMTTTTTTKFYGNNHKYQTNSKFVNNYSKDSYKDHNVDINNNDQDFIALANANDPLCQLINKAKSIVNVQQTQTTENQTKIQKAKKQLRMQKQKNNTFLTGTGLYEVQVQPQPVPDVQDIDIDPNDLLKQLLDRQRQDDLAQLRRMIKKTDKNLNTYERQIYHSSQEVINAADHFKKQVDYGLMNKMNKIGALNDSPVLSSMSKKNSNVPQKTRQKRMTGSVNRIKDSKYY